MMARRSKKKCHNLNNGFCSPTPSFALIGFLVWFLSFAELTLFHMTFSCAQCVLFNGDCSTSFVSPDHSPLGMFRSAWKVEDKKLMLPSNLHLLLCSSRHEKSSSVRLVSFCRYDSTYISAVRTNNEIILFKQYCVHAFCSPALWVIITCTCLYW